MPIFARRSLQRLLDENSEFLSPVQTKRLVERLNRMDKDLTLSPEWEVALLNALSKAGRVIYEKDFGGTNRADIYFESRDNPDHRFVAEITSVSDRGLDQLNPFDALSHEFNNIIRNRGLNPTRFSLKVGAHGEPHYKGGAKVRLKLTGRARFNEKIFGPDFYRFVENIARELESPNRFLVQTDEIDLEIGYDPARKYGEGVYLDYNVVYSLTNNVIYNALSEKASQLDGTNFHGPRGIILCDGSCMFLSQPPIGDLSYTCDEVIWHFLNENSSINFILTCVVKDVGDHSSPYLGPFRLSLHLYKGLQYDDISLDLWEFVQELEFPAPKLNARNAMNHLKGPRAHDGLRRGGAAIIKTDRATVKVSARSLLELIAGRISQKEFLERCCESFSQNAFEEALRGCQLIVSVERSPEEDDDWVIFEMAGPDPAIAPFAIPIKGGGK